MPGSENAGLSAELGDALKAYLGRRLPDREFLERILAGLRATGDDLHPILLPEARELESLRSNYLQNDHVGKESPLYVTGGEISAWARRFDDMLAKMMQAGVLSTPRPAAAEFLRFPLRMATYRGVNALCGPPTVIPGRGNGFVIFPIAPPPAMELTLRRSAAGSRFKEVLLSELTSTFVRRCAATFQGERYAVIADDGRFVFLDPPALKHREDEAPWSLVQPRSEVEAFTYDEVEIDPADLWKGFHNLRI